MGTHQNLTEAVLMSLHNLCFEQKCEKYQNFLSEKINFQFLVVKFSVYLNRCFYNGCMEQISMVQKMFIPLKFDCILHLNYADKGLV